MNNYGLTTYQTQKSKKDKKDVDEKIKKQIKN